LDTIYCVFVTFALHKDSCFFVFSDSGTPLWYFKVPSRSPRGPQDSPRDPQEPSRGTQEISKRTPEITKNPLRTSPEHPEVPQEVPRDPYETHVEVSEAPSFAVVYWKLLAVVTHALQFLNLHALPVPLLRQVFVEVPLTRNFLVKPLTRS
jgi:hypothetical protein